MDLTNHTRYPAGIARMVIGQDDRIAASVLARVTYDLRGGKLVPSEEQPWIFSLAPWEGPRGWMDGDMVYYKGGVDLFVFGKAVPLGGKPATEMDVEIRVGRGFRRSVRVFGTRVWYRRLGNLVPTAPLPFESLPLGLSSAYGGVDTWDGLQIPWPANPEGMGFYTSAETAVDRPLPHLEEPADLIVKWDDRRDPAGLCQLPPGSPLRTKHGFRVDKGEPRMTPRLFNTAFASMVAPSAAARERVVVTGASADGPLVFDLPELPFLIRLRFGDETAELPLKVDQIGIESDVGRVFVAYRCPFRYVVVPRQIRECHLLEKKAGTA